MPETTILTSSAESFGVQITSATLSGVLTAGTGSVLQVSSGNPGLYFNVSQYECLQSFLGFDLSAIPPGAKILSATFECFASASTSGNTGELELVPYDWGPSQEGSDALTAAQYAAIPVLASYFLPSTITAGDSFLFFGGPSLVDALTPGQLNKFLLCNRAFRDQSTPVGFEHTTETFLGDITDLWKPRLNLLYEADNALFFGSNF